MTAAGETDTPADRLAAAWAAFGPSLMPVPDAFAAAGAIASADIAEVVECDLSERRTRYLGWFATLRGAADEKAHYAARIEEFDPPPDAYVWHLGPASAEAVREGFLATVAAGLPPPRMLLGVYRWVGPVGEGGEGHVHEYADAYAGTRVAIKFPLAAHGGDTGGTFGTAPAAADVARLWSRVGREHPHLVALRHVLPSNVAPLALVSDFVAGPTLHEAMRGGPPLAPRTAADLVRMLATALADTQADAPGWTHQDVKPQNVLLETAREAGPHAVIINGTAYRPRLTDFGFAFQGTPSAIAGTRGYLSPEHAPGKEPSHRSDVYSLGVVLFELITGTMDVGKGWPGAVKVPRRVRQACDNALRPAESRRPTAAQFASALALSIDTPRRTTRVALALATTVLLAFAAFWSWHKVAARTTVARIGETSFGNVPALADDLREYQFRPSQPLRVAYAEAGLGTSARLKYAIALAADDPAAADEVAENMDTIPPMDLKVLRDTLGVPIAAAIARAPGRITPAKAVFVPVPDDQVRFVAEDTINAAAADPGSVPAWAAALVYRRAELRMAVAAVYADTFAASIFRRAASAGLLAEWGSERERVELLTAADVTTFKAIYPYVTSPECQAMIWRAYTASAGPNERFNLLTALTLAGHPAGTAEFQRAANADADPDFRTRLLHDIAGLGLRPPDVVPWLASEPAVGIHLLGHLDTTAVPAADRNGIIAALLRHYENNPDPAVHSLAWWLLKRWNGQYPADGIGPALAAARDRMIARDRDPTKIRRAWFVNALGQTMVVIEAGTPFVTGGAQGELGKESVEPRGLHVVKYRFAIAATETTEIEYGGQTGQRPWLVHEITGGRATTNERPNGTQPARMITRPEAQQYCNLVSKMEGIARWYPDFFAELPPVESQDDAAYARPGYRLPTEFEWECACRARGITAWGHGSAASYLLHYATTACENLTNAEPVGLRRPNRYGLFDMHGNVTEWCENDPQHFGGRIHERPDTPCLFVARGGSYSNTASHLRAATRFQYPNQNLAYPTVGVRIVRTLPPLRSSP